MCVSCVYDLGKMGSKRRRGRKKRIRRRKNKKPAFKKNNNTTEIVQTTKYKLKNNVRKKDTNIYEKHQYVIKR